MFKDLSPGAIGIGANLSQGLELAKSAGFDGLDINIGEVTNIANEKGINHVKDLFAEADLRVGGWILPVNYNGSDQEYYETLSQFPKFARIASELNSTGCVIWIGPGSGRSFKENWDFHVKRFRPIAEILADHGQRIGLEFIGPRTSRAGAPHGFVYSLDGMLGLAVAISTGNVGLLLDTWHWYTAQDTVSDLEHLTDDDIVYVHVNDAPAGIHVNDQIDSVRCMPYETGVIPLDDFFKAMKKIGYTGPVTVEPFSQRIREMSPIDATNATKKSLDLIWERADI